MKIEQWGSYLDYMLQQTRMHHVQLSNMADVKANMLLTISAVVLTLSVRYIVDPQLKWPVLVLIVFCFLTILLATYAVMPKLPIYIKPLPRVDLTAPGFDLLFFASFVRLEYDEFETAMAEIMNDPSRTYQAQVHEIYAMGTYLAKRKYRYLKCAYITFLAGIFASGQLMVLISAIN